MTESRVVDQFVVVCQVSGGVTGWRRGLLREKGQTVLFPTEEAAEARCKELRAKMGRGGWAEFRYTPAPACQGLAQAG